ncbi:hypothetical protein [Kluyvera genomosp. 1]|uniref:hypothetical protein n=1 Tax=Kluyvera genomosp. 1 TaxID=2774053 RepID=UPI00069055EE|nr:hypothetical protein [Kluyvera genomosp. 1]
MLEGRCQLQLKKNKPDLLATTDFAQNSHNGRVAIPECALHHFKPDAGISMMGKDEPLPLAVRVFFWIIDMTWSR